MSIVQPAKDNSVNQSSVVKADEVFNEVSEYLLTHELCNFLIHEDPVQKNSIIIEIKGRKDTIHEGANYFVQMIIPSTYPSAPPKCIFIGVIPYHHNITSYGICLDYLYDWKSTNTFLWLIHHIESLIYRPTTVHGRFVEHILNEAQKIECRKRVDQSKQNSMKSIFIQGG